MTTEIVGTIVALAILAVLRRWHRRPPRRRPIDATLHREMLRQIAASEYRRHH